MPFDDRPAKPAAGARQTGIAARLAETRALSLEIAAPLSPEDQVVQAMDDASPTKWHLGHTAWFFEELVLKRFLPGYRAFDALFAYCFNSYYESLGPRHPRPRRGLLTRPSADEVRAYRAYVDESLMALLAGSVPEDALGLIEVGVNHEQQHQELMLTDILALFAANPLRPAYRKASPAPAEAPGAGHWRQVPGGIYEIGHRGEGFAFDNEGPAHRVLLPDFQIFSREVTNGEWLAFMEAGGYSEPSFWLSDGWATVQREGWQRARLLGAEGRKLAANDFAGAGAGRGRAAGHACELLRGRCLSRAGRDTVCQRNSSGRLLLRTKRGRPRSIFRGFMQSPPPRPAKTPLSGNVWQWTQSAYLPYPGYKPAPGALGEYNGKFMCNQIVLRGGSFATPNHHLRPTYRNFFYPQQRWQFMGLRLASDA